MQRFRDFDYPVLYFRCHAGEVTSLTGSRLSSMVLSGGVDGKACIYDINRKVMVNHVQYSSSVTSIKWLPLDVSNTQHDELEFNQKKILHRNRIWG